MWGRGFAPSKRGVAPLPHGRPDSKASANAAEGGFGGMRFEHLHAVQNRSDYVLVPDYRIDHQVIKAAGRPVGVEVVFDVGDPLLVHVRHQVFRLVAALADCRQAANLFVMRSIGEDTESVLTLTQEERSASTDN